MTCEIVTYALMVGTVDTGSFGSVDYLSRSSWPLRISLVQSSFPFLALGLRLCATMTSWLSTSAEDWQKVSPVAAVARNVVIFLMQEIRRQLEQLTGKGEEKLKIDDVGSWRGR